MEKPRVYADFKKGIRTQGEHWLFLTQPKTYDDMSRLHLTPQVGVKAIFYTRDIDAAGNPVEIEAEGTIKYALAHGWVAVIDESTIKHNPAAG